METHEILKNLGLSEKEAGVYLALLELGEAAVGRIAEQSRIKRSTVYVVLEELERKGYVTKAILEGVNYFYPEHPQKVLTEAELRLEELKTALPQMESLLNKQANKPRVVVYEGKDDLDRAYDESFIAKGEVLYMSTLKLSRELFQKTFRKMDLIPLSENYQMRELVDDSEDGKQYAEKVGEEYRQVRLIPAQFLPFEVDIGIFDNSVLVTSLKRNYFTVKIQSPEIAQAFRHMFEALWQVSKKTAL